MWRTVLIYAGLLVVAALGLQWIEYKLLVREHPGELYIALIAASFLALGVWAGTRLVPRRAAGEAFVTNVRVRETLGIRLLLPSGPVRAAAVCFTDATGGPSPVLA